jgi:hypothetical protein
VMFAPAGDQGTVAALQSVVLVMQLRWAKLS